MHCKDTLISGSAIFNSCSIASHFVLHLYIELRRVTLVEIDGKVTGLVHMSYFGHASDAIQTVGNETIVRLGISLSSYYLNRI